MVSIDKPGENNFLLENATAEPSLYGFEVPIYCFGSEFNIPYSPYDRISCAYHEEDCILDSLLLAQWEDRLWRGCFKYDVTSSQIRAIAGPLKFIAQLNPSWCKTHISIPGSKICSRRKLSMIDSNRLNEKLLFCLATDENAKSKLIPSAFVPDDSLLVILNETPIDYGHVFLVPFRFNSRARHLDAPFLEMILRMAVEINNSSFRLLYDCSSSASQPYFEACYFPNPLTVELMPLDSFFNDERTGIRICSILHYPIKSLFFESSHNFKAFVDIISQISSWLMESNIAYNMLVSDCGRKVYLFLQATFRSLSGWECGGYFLFNTQAEFDKATEESMFDLLYRSSIDIEGFETVKQMCCKIAVSYTA